MRGLFADDATWIVPGDGVMAGTFRGREEIFRFLGRLPKETDGTYGSRLIDVLASDNRAAALYRASGERVGRGSTSTRCCSSASSPASSRRYSRSRRIPPRSRISGRDERAFRA